MIHTREHTLKGAPMRQKHWKRIILGSIGTLVMLMVLIQPVMAMTGSEFDLVATITSLFTRVNSQDEKIADLENQIKDLKDLLDETKIPPEVITIEEPQDPIIEPEPPVEEEEPADPKPDPVITLKLSVTTAEVGLRLSWTKETSDELRGYKVVISETNPKPSYPDDGYLRWITDREETSILIDNSECYNGGDINGYLKADTTYYFTITYLYESGKKTTATVAHKTPSDLNVPHREKPLDPESLILSVDVLDASIRLNWTAEPSEALMGYKVVISESNPTPSYPDDGYLRWITDRNETSLLIDNLECYNGGDINSYLKPDTAYYFTITYLYEDHKVTTAPVMVTTPSALPVTQ